MDWLRSRNTDWQKFLGLSGRERWLLVFSVLLLPVVVLAHRVLGLRRIQSILGLFSAERAYADDSELQSMRLARSASRIVQIAGKRGLCSPTCLQRSVFLRWLLAREGVLTDLRLGVSKRDGLFEAHAWVEYLGRALNESEDVGDRYAPFPGRLPASMASRS